MNTPHKKPVFRKPPNKVKMCKFCGKKHAMRKELCPACGKSCSKCHKENHFSVKCQNINLVENESYSCTTDEDELWLNAVYDNKTTLTAVMIVNNCSIRSQLDSGAETNTIHQKYVRIVQVRPSSTTLCV